VAEDNTTYWIPDFNVAHYQTMLFGKKAAARSMYTYFLQQSAGKYASGGKVYGWVQVSHSEAYYGVNDGARVPELVREAVHNLGDSVPWADYDENGDGIVDHVQFVHAGIDQSAGGPAWTIWAHSSTVRPAAPTSDPNVVVGPYTINPEDGAIGVFCHEFAHNLGLPDLYDTIYSGESSAGFWTLMSNGSWLGAKGEALGTTPPSLGPWERAQLGFVKPVVIKAGQAKKTVLLDPAAKAGAGTRAIRVNLPDNPWTLSLNTPHSGTHEWWSDKGDMITTTLTRNVTLPAGSVLTFWSWWDIEADFDYGYVEVLPAGGATWQTVEGNITTNDNPYLANDGNGITGPSLWFPGNVDGWVPATFDLSAYTGAVKLRFRYTTDPAATGNGWTWNNLLISAGGTTVFQDSAESVDPGWVADGWQRTTGDLEKTAKNYYMIEWRQPIGFDVSMNSWHNWLDHPRAEFFKASPGMLVWYYTDQFSDNWVGVHPWQGMLQVVDARPARIPAVGTEALSLQYFGVSEGLPAVTRVNLADATFNLGFQTSQDLMTTYAGTAATVRIPAGARIPVFNDAKPWVDRFWEPHLTWDPDLWPARYTSPKGWLTNSLNSTTVPVRGVKISVAPRPGKNAGGQVTVNYSRPIE
jgi:immune inhibitor A